MGETYSDTNLLVALSLRTASFRNIFVIDETTVCLSVAYEKNQDMSPE